MHLIIDLIALDCTRTFVRTHATTHVCTHTRNHARNLNSRKSIQMSIYIGTMPKSIFPRKTLYERRRRGMADGTELQNWSYIDFHSS